MNRKKSFFSGIGIILVLVTMPAYGGWDTSISKDEMTGEISAYARSPITAPTKSMPPPFSDTKGWLGVGCNGEGEWAYVSFSLSPDLSDRDIHNGYNNIKTRIKWDDRVENVTLREEWFSKLIEFYDDKSVISNIAKSSTVVLELKWRDEGTIYFKFPLSGSSAALKVIRNACSMKIK